MTRYPVLRHLWRSAGIVWVWAGLLVFMFAVTFVVSLFRDIEISGWGAAVYIAPWYMLAMGIYLTTVNVPLYVTHGVTRRTVIAQAFVYAVALALTGAALIVAGFLIERGVYSVLDWPQKLGDDATGLFTSADQYGWIFLGFLLSFALFFAVGAAIGAAFYRKAWGGLGGLVAIVAGLALITPAAIAGAASVPPSGLTDLIAGDWATPVIVATCAVAICAATALAWSMVRDIPVRSETT